MSQRPVTVLLIAAGSPGDYHIIKGLKQSLRYAVTLHAADCDPLKGNLYLPGVDKAHILPRYDAPDYIEAILALVRSMRADVLISDLDEELPALSRMSDKLMEAGCAVVLPPPHPLELCLDKLETHRRLHGNVFTPTTIPGNASDPECGPVLLRHYGAVILKPRYLRGGRGVDLARNEEELEFYKKRHGERGPFVIQPYLRGREFNVSMLNDLTGRLIYCAVREKLEDRLVKSNTIAARVVRNESVKEQALTAVRDLGLNRGFNNVEVILSDGVPWVIDVNGGRWAGQDMNLLASGVNQGELYLDLALGHPVQPIDVPIGAISLKVKMDVIVTEDELAGAACGREALA